MGFMSKLLSFGSDKDLKRYYKIVDQINGLEPQFEKMTEEELRGQTDKFRERYANGESLDDMLPEAFATVREASKRTMGMRHFDVQLIGAMALHEGHIAEMKTGEGKTLVSASTLQKDVKANLEKTNNVDAAAYLGTVIAKRAIEKGINTVVFDRGGFIYQGKVQALADAAREAGLNF